MTKTRKFVVDGETVIRQTTKMIAVEDEAKKQQEIDLWQVYYTNYVHTQNDNKPLEIHNNRPHYYNYNYYSLLNHTLWCNTNERTALNIKFETL